MCKQTLDVSSLHDHTHYGYESMKNDLMVLNIISFIRLCSLRVT